jgi:hypothetical protein
MLSKVRPAAASVNPSRSWRSVQTVWSREHLDAWGLSIARSAKRAGSVRPIWVGRLVLLEPSYECLGHFARIGPRLAGASPLR